MIGRSLIPGGVWFLGIDLGDECGYFPGIALIEADRRGICWACTESFQACPASLHVSWALFRPTLPQSARQSGVFVLYDLLKTE